MTEIRSPPGASLGSATPRLTQSTTESSRLAPAAPSVATSGQGTAETPSSSAVVAEHAPASKPTQLAARSRFAAQEVHARGQVQGLTLLPGGGRASLSPGLYQAQLTSGTSARTFFGENDVPMTAMVINSSTIKKDGLEPRYIAQAAVTANPDIRLLVPTLARFDSTSDPRFASARNQLAERLGVPAENVMPVRSDMAMWPQDEFLAGFAGGKPTLIKPTADSVASETYSRRSPREGAGSTSHWNQNQRTHFAAADLAHELGIQAAKSDAIARGGDTHIVTRPNGTQAAFFSGETVRHAAETRGIDASTPKGFLQGLDVTMRGLRDAGIPLDQIAPLGRGTTTYGHALASMTPDEKAMLDPQVRARFEQMRTLPLPQRSYAYHTDLAFFTPNGKAMFVNADVAKLDPTLKKQLDFFGYDMHTLPARSIRPEQAASEGFTTSSPMRQTYMNMVMGKSADGKPLILMPTEAMDPKSLTPRDEEARRALMAAVPDARIVPVGGRSALVGFGKFQDGYIMERDWGIHCMSNVVPFDIQLR